MKTPHLTRNGDNMQHSPHYYWERMRAEFKGAKACNVGFAENELSLAYHDTVVARYYFDTRDLTLDSGGWRPRPGGGRKQPGYFTKGRINRFLSVLDLGVRVCQHSHEWTVLGVGMNPVPFEDGMALKAEVGVPPEDGTTQ